MIRHVWHYRKQIVPGMRSALLVALLYWPMIGTGQLEVKTTPATLLYLRATLQLELPLSKQTSVEVVGRRDYLFRGTFGANLFLSERFRSALGVSDWDILGDSLHISGIANNVGLSVAGKYFFAPGEEGSDRFYGFGYLKYRNYGLRDDRLGLTLNYRRLSPGLGLGFKWVVGHHLVFDVGSGMGYSLYHVFTDNIPLTPAIHLPSFPLANIDVYARCSLGYRF